MKNNDFLKFIGMVWLCFGVVSCAPIVAGAAIGVAGTVAVYDRQTIQKSLEDYNRAHQIIKQLQADPEVKKKCHISVAAYHGTILLVGQAPTLELSERAENIAKSVTRFKRFYNEITIEEPTSTMTRASDTWITTKVKSLLLATKDLKSGQIKILTENSTVFLMGIVNRPQANLAVQVIKQVEGVKKVVKVFQYTS